MLILMTQIRLQFLQMSCQLRWLDWIVAFDYSFFFFIKMQWISFREMHFKNVFCKMAAMPQCINGHFVHNASIYTWTFFLSHTCIVKSNHLFTNRKLSSYMKYCCHFQWKPVQVHSGTDYQSWTAFRGIMYEHCRIQQKTWQTPGQR